MTSHIYGIYEQIIKKSNFCGILESLVTNCLLFIILNDHLYNFSNIFINIELKD